MPSESPTLGEYDIQNARRHSLSAFVCIVHKVYVAHILMMMYRLSVRRFCFPLALWEWLFI